MSANVPAVKGAARYYAAGSNVYMQPIDDETGKLVPHVAELIDSAATPTAAAKKADRWQKQENAAVIKAAGVKP